MDKGLENLGPWGIDHRIWGTRLHNGQTPRYIEKKHHVTLSNFLDGVYSKIGAGWGNVKREWKQKLCNCRRDTEMAR